MTLASDVGLVTIFHKHGCLIWCHRVLYEGSRLCGERIVERLLTREEGWREDPGGGGHGAFHGLCNGGTEGSAKEEIGGSGSIQGKELALNLELIGFFLAKI